MRIQRGKGEYVNEYFSKDRRHVKEGGEAINEETETQEEREGAARGQSEGFPPLRCDAHL